MSVENILTIDVEDWYHICGVDKLIPEKVWPQLESRVTNSTRKILDILSKKSVEATFFVLGFVAEKHPELVREIDAAGQEIAVHGYAHRHVYAMSPESFRQDLKRATNVISEITGRPVKGYRAPEWSIRDDSLWALEILRQEGYEYDSSMAPLPIIGNQNYTATPYKRRLSQGHIWEFPPLVATTTMINLPVGGGWGLRVFPFNLIRASIQNLNNKGYPGLIFLHPREFDSNNPRVKLPFVKKFVLEARFERTEKRLDRLLDEFRFTSISNFLKKKKLGIYPTLCNV